MTHSPANKPTLTKETNDCGSKADLKRAGQATKNLQNNKNPDCSAVKVEADNRHQMFFEIKERVSMILEKKFTHALDDFREVWKSMNPIEQIAKGNFLFPNQGNAFLPTGKEKTRFRSIFLSFSRTTRAIRPNTALARAIV